VHGEHGAVGAIEPGEDDELLADAQAVRRLGDAGVEIEPRLGRSFVALLRRLIAGA